jgi:hypothetical protein
MTPFADFTLVVLVGVGATAVMDIWLILLKRLGVRRSTSPFSVAGSATWPAQVRARGNRQVPGVAGRTRARLALPLRGGDRFRDCWSASGHRVGPSADSRPGGRRRGSTVVAPLFVMQPAMGAGFAAAKTPTPVRNCCALANHTVFGIGLYVAALFIRRLWS